jgi:general stress protein 26
MTLEQSRSLDDLVRPGDVAMLTTVDEQGALSSRPLAIADVHGGVLTFLVDCTASWFSAVDDDPLADGRDPFDATDRRVHPNDVALTITTGRNDWLSMRARATTTFDRTTIDRLWSTAGAAYFDGPDDPTIRALQLSLLDGEYWSAPGGGALGRLVAVVGAVIGRDDSMANDHGPIRRD